MNFVPHCNENVNFTQHHFSTISTCPSHNKAFKKVRFMLTKITYENYKLRCRTVNSDIILIKSCGGFGENAANLPFNYCKHFLGISG